LALPCCFFGLSGLTGLDGGVVAEGVEDRATLDLLAQLGCDQAQGYYLSRPLPAEAIAEWVHELETLESRRADAA